MTNKEKIQKLKNNGYNPKIRHLRYLRNGLMVSMGDYYKNFSQKERSQHPITPIGGVTEITLLNKENKPVATVFARCHEKLDNYNKKIGVEMCLERLNERFNQNKVKAL